MRPHITDETLVAAIEEAAEEHGSKTDAIRYAIRRQFVETHDEQDDEPQPATIADTIKEKSLRKAHRCLWSVCRGKEGGRNDVGHTSADTARSVLAQEFGVNKAAVKSLYLTPLKAQKIIDVNPGSDQTIVYVVDPDATAPADMIDEQQPADTDTDSEADVDNRLEQLDAATRETEAQA